MPENCHRITLLMLLLFFSAVSFAQPVPSEPTPPGYVKEQRKLKSWWDEPTAVSVLKLDKEQQDGLAGLREDFVSVFKANSDKLKDQDKLLGQAILAADDQQVVSVKKEMLDLVATNATLQVEYKIAGLALLNQQQLAGLAASYPDVLNKKWGLRTKGMTRPKGSDKAGRGAKLMKTEKSKSEENKPEESDKE